MSAAEDTKRFLINDSSSLRDIFLAYSDSIKPKTSSIAGGPPPPPPPPPQGPPPPPPPPRQGPSIEYIYKGLSPSRTTAAPPPPRGPPSPKRGPPSPKRGPPSPKRGPPSPKRGPSPCSSSGAAATTSSSMDQPSNKSSSGFSGDRRPSVSSLPSTSTSSPVVKKEPKEVEKKTPFRRIRSPSRPRAWLSKVPTSAYKIPGFYKPRYHVHHQENPFHRPGFHHFGFRPYHQYPPGGYFHRRDPPPSALDLKREKDRIREREKERDRKDDKGSSPKDSLSAPLTPLFPRSTSSRERDKQLSSSQDRESDRAQSGERERGRDSTMSRITARNRAIQQKRREIEEVYRQDCDTFAVVVRMLIAKDPQLEPTLQGSLQDNLRDIGHRCVEAMQAFIEEYDAKHAKKDPPPSSSHASPTLARAHSTHSL